MAADGFKMAANGFKIATAASSTSSKMADQQQTVDVTMWIAFT